MSLDYLLQRESWRLKAAAELAKDSPAGAELLRRLRDITARTVISISGAGWGQRSNAEYLVGLSVGFLRTQLIILDLAEGSEVADGATLLRKNLEAAARILELENGADPSTLFGRPPNVAALRGPAPKLYGSYSEIAHSSHPRVGQLLGGRADDAPGWVSAYPKYGSNSLVLVSNVFVVYGDFYLWSRDVFADITDKYPRAEIDAEVSQLIAVYEALEQQLDATGHQNSSGPQR